MEKFYAFGSGSFGCVFDHMEGPFNTPLEAAQAAAAMFELRDAGIECLALNKFLNLADYRETFIDDLDESEGIGADYIEIFEVAEDWVAAD